MNESILTSTKKVLGIDENYLEFDPDIIMHINAALFSLNQLSVGPKEGFIISDKSTLWSEFESRKDLIAIQSYIYLRVRLLFDPPTSSFVLDSMDRQRQELEWRLNIQAEGGPDFGAN